LNNARRLEIAFGIDEAGSHFSENTKPFEAPTALYSELALEYTNVIKPCGREVNQLALKRQRFRQIECHPASAADVTPITNSASR
jgi:hypothetical protein